jgi:hypothetical protein
LPPISPSKRGKNTEQIERKSTQIGRSRKATYIKNVEAERENKNQTEPLFKPIPTDMLVGAEVIGTAISTK